MLQEQQRFVSLSNKGGMAILAIWGPLFVLGLLLGVWSDIQAVPISQAIPCTAVQDIPGLECAALLALYDGTNGANWRDTINNTEIPEAERWFATPNACSWDGIGCSDVQEDGKRHVISIRVDARNLRGNIPDTQDFAQLDDLVRLSLSNNPGMTGSIPSKLGQMPALKRFHCRNCSLNGPLPDTLMTGNLDALWLSGNIAMTGTIDSSSGLWNIPVLDISHTRLSGEMPGEVAENAIWFQIHSSCFTGAIPDVELGYTMPRNDLLDAYGDFAFGVGSNRPKEECPSPPGTLNSSDIVKAMTDLRDNGTAGTFGQLRFVNSDLTAVPEILAAFQGVRQLEISFGRLAGPLSAVVWELPNLTHLALNDNAISSLSEPTTLYPSLVLVYLYNNQLSGTLPAWFGGFPNLTTLHLQNNQFTGELPRWLCGGVYGSLHLQGNLFYGPIPDCIGQLDQIRLLTLGGTPNAPSRLRGTLPGSFADLTSLTLLTIVHTDIGGPIDAIAALPNLTSASLQSNDFGGTIPDFANAANMCRLVLNDNHLQGEIPPSFKDIGTSPNCTKLELNLQMNALSVAADQSAEVRDFLAKRDPDWEKWQTVPPTDTIVTEIYSSGLEVMWTPISYNTGRGWYRIEAEPLDPGPDGLTECRRIQVANTDSKYAGRATVLGLLPGTDYRITVQTITQANPPGAFAPFHSKTSLPSAPVTARTQEIGLLSLYMLALDSNLDKYHDAALDAMQQASHADPTEFTVALVDREGDGNTEIVLMLGGCRVSLTAQGLPRRQADGTVALDAGLNELDMTDGEVLGAFLRWAIEEYAPDPNIPVVATFIGHGIAIAPEVEALASLFDVNAGEEPDEGCDDTGVLCILPNRQDINPGYWTDTVFGEPRLITPYELRQALEIGTNNGARPIAVLDIAHCFGGSIEELYELTYTDEQTPGPMVDAIVASPSYTYFGDEVLARTVVTPLLSYDSSEEKALAIVDSYERALAAADTYDGDDDVDHPRIIVPLLAGKIPAIKPAVDALAASLLATEVGLTELLTETHASAVKYDTTLCADYCPPDTPDCEDEERVPDWAVDTKDGLVDLRSMALTLATKSGAPADVQAAAGKLLKAVDDALIPAGDPWLQARQNGRLWHALEEENPDTFWTFDESAGGISIFMDLVNQVDDEGKKAAGWQAYWYSTDAYGDKAPLNNPHPHEFFAGEQGWDDLLNSYWKTVREDQGENYLRARACMLTLQPLAKELIYELHLPIVVQDQ